MLESPIVDVFLSYDMNVTSAPSPVKEVRKLVASHFSSAATSLPVLVYPHDLDLTVSSGLTYLMVCCHGARNNVYYLVGSR